MTATPTNVPARKITLGMATGAFVTLIVGVLNSYIPFFEHKPISGGIAGSATTLLTFIVSYMVRPGDNEGTIIEAGGLARQAKVTR